MVFRPYPRTLECLTICRCHKWQKKEKKKKERERTVEQTKTNTDCLNFSLFSIHILVFWGFFS